MKIAVRKEEYGTFFVMPLDKEADQWCDENIPEDQQVYFGGTFLMDARAYLTFETTFPGEVVEGEGDI